MTADAFDALYQQTARDLLTYLLRRTPSPEDAADCLAETFLIAWDKRDRMPAEFEHARPWLYGVARNVLRRGQERTARASAAVEALARELDGVQQPPSEADPVGTALQRLAPLDREIIEMLAWDQLAPRDVAVILGLSPNVVRVRAHRARQRLREILSSEDPPSVLSEPLTNTGVG